MALIDHSKTDWPRNVNDRSNMNIVIRPLISFHVMSLKINEGKKTFVFAYAKKKKFE